MSHDLSSFVYQRRGDKPYPHNADLLKSGWHKNLPLPYNLYGLWAYQDLLGRRGWRPILIALSVCHIVYCGQMVQDKSISVYGSQIGTWGRHLNWYHFRPPPSPP